MKREYDGEGKSPANPKVVEAVLHQIDSAMEAYRRRPVVIGICGAQGSGKSTLAAAAAQASRRQGLNAAVLSLDDLYLTRAERQALGRTTHPLLVTRGVPGTHDVALGMETLDCLASGMPTALPRFDKAVDDRMPERDWPIVDAGCDVLLFEGWCVGAFPQPANDLERPVNALEAEEDVGGYWRRAVNDTLGDSYQRLFARLDRLILLAAPGFDVVHGWRLEQERSLAGMSGSDARSLMDETEIARFIAHYERLTRWILTEMPKRADLLVRLGAQRQVVDIRQG